MKSRWILNLALVVLIAALAALVYFRPAVDKPTGPPLMTLSAEAVSKIRIEKSGQGAVALEKTAGGWRLQAPVRARASRFNVASLLRVTTATSSFQTSADAAALATYGLDKPSVRLLLNDEEILVGAIHPMRQQHYLRYRDTIHLVDSHALAMALLNYTSFIDSQLIEDGHKLIALRLPDVRLVLKDGVWRREPHDAKISLDNLNEFVAHWQNARALAVEKLSATPTLAQIALTVDQGDKPATLKLDILAYKPEFVLARRDEGLEYHFPEETGKRLLNLDTSEK